MEFNGTTADVLSSLTPNEVATLRRRFGVHKETNPDDVDSIIPPPPTDDGSGGGVPAPADPLD